MPAEELILVNERDEPVGACGKITAHEQGWLHRAFSIFLFNTRGEMLLQQRALAKYHSGGLWTNACCSHPYPGEDTGAAALRRLREELNCTVPLEKIFDFVYRASFDNGLTEHEFDHVFTGRCDVLPDPHPGEVMAVAFRSVPELKEEMSLHPERYTAWFRIAFPKVEAWWQENRSRFAG